EAAEYRPPPEEPDKEYPFWLTTGRVVYHWHTRTKTGRCLELQQAAPGPYAQISEPDARRLGVAEGDLVEVASRRGSVRAPARVGDYLGLLQGAHEQLEGACRAVADRYPEEPEARDGLAKLAQFSAEAVEALRPFVAAYGERRDDEPEDVREALLPAGRSGAY